MEKEDLVQNKEQMTNEIESLKKEKSDLKYAEKLKKVVIENVVIILKY